MPMMFTRNKIQVVISTFCLTNLACIVILMEFQYLVIIMYFTNQVCTLNYNTFLISKLNTYYNKSALMYCIVCNKKVENI